MSTAHRHLKRPMAEEFTNGAEIDAVHDQSTGKSVPVAMPGIIRKLCCFENPNDAQRKILQALNVGLPRL